jgi:hypothetical protein
MLTFTHQIGPGSYFALTFSEKPCERIRWILKASGFRWSPAAGTWWRSKTSGAADYIADLRATIDRAEGIRRPVGACWVCQSPDGFFRNRGAAAPVWCDACAARVEAEEKTEEAAADARYCEHKRQEAGDWFDMAVEDSMRDAGGL